LEEFLEERPSKGILVGELKAREDVKAPISLRGCALFKIKEKTRTYHSSGASKKTTDRTYFSSGDPFLEAQGQEIGVDIEKKAEIRLSDTVKSKFRCNDDIPLSLKKIRDGDESEIKDGDHSKTVENPRNRNLEFVEKPVQIGTRVHLLFKDQSEKQKIENVFLLTDRNPRKIGLKLFPMAMLLTGLGIIFLTVGLVSLTWI
jgi:hypothetical protein